MKGRRAVVSGPPPPGPIFHPFDPPPPAPAADFNELSLRKRGGRVYPIDGSKTSEALNRVPGT